MIGKTEIEKQLSHLGQELVAEILTVSAIVDVDKNTEIVKEGQSIRHIPLVLSGLVKVSMRKEDKELLLYYIQPVESCVMSFSACLKNEESKIFATTEENSTIILLPAGKVLTWINEFPKLNGLFYQQYNLRYLDLLETINQLLYDKLDKRLYAYLKEKVLLTGKNPYIISHREIAYELGTAREVISRVLKKLERENKIRQLREGIKIL